MLEKRSKNEGHITSQSKGEGKEQKKKGKEEGERAKTTMRYQAGSWYSFRWKAGSGERKVGCNQTFQPRTELDSPPPPRSSPCEPWMEHYTKKLVHICYHFLRSPLPGLVGTLIIQGVHLCSCHAGCSLWSAKQLKGKSQTLGCLGRERKEELLLFAQIFMFPESRLPSPNATCSERMEQSQFHLAFLLN